MANNQYLKKIAIVGASGNVGSATLKNLLEINRDIQITIVSRPESASTFPTSSQITVKKGSYDDASFLESAFAGHDLVMFALAWAAAKDELKLIDAAAKAGVKWIITNEYAGDGLNPVHRGGNPLYQDKINALKRVEALAETHAGLKWIGVTTNIWTEIALIENTGFGVDIANRTATLWSDAGAFNTSTRNQVGLGIAKLLSLPVTSASNPRASLQHYGNNFAYISSFLVSQRKLVEAAQRVTGTTDADWKFTHSSSAEQIKAANDSAASDPMRAMFTMVIANYMVEGRGGDYESKAKEDRKILGLQEENLDEVLQRHFGKASS